MRNLFLTVVTLLFCSALFAQDQKIAEFSSPKGYADIQWGITTQDLGNIEQNIPLTVEFELKNSGNAPLFITKVVGSCGCTATDYSKEPINPGATSIVKATYDAKSKGAFSKTVTVFTNAPEERSVLTLKGKVI